MTNGKKKKNLNTELPHRLIIEKPQQNNNTIIHHNNINLIIPQMVHLKLDTTPVRKAMMGVGLAVAWTIININAQKTIRGCARWSYSLSTTSSITYYN
jgi:hypothetical protein